jgi:hypothetical protein
MTAVAGTNMTVTWVASASGREAGRNSVRTELARGSLERAREPRRFCVEEGLTK